MSLKIKVFGIVSCQLLITSAIVSMFMYIELFQILSLQYNRCLVLTGFFSSILALFACMLTKNDYPTNIYWLVLFTISNAIELGAFCGVLTHAGYKILIIQALGLTSLFTIILTRIAITTEKDYSYIRPLLNTIIFGLITAGVVTLTIYEIPYHGMIVGITGSVTFCVYLFMFCSEAR